MPSPFPGMDPYLETHWRDVHSRLVLYASDALQPALPAGLKARVEERVFLEWPDGSMQPRYPDVGIFTERSGKVAGGAVALLEPATPLLVEMPVGEISEKQIQILDTRNGNRLVTCIEVLSPTNKLPGAGWVSYQGKRDEMLFGGASFVEIDLLRGGDYALYRDPAYAGSPRGEYHVCVTRADQFLQRSEVYALPLWRRLPVIRIPLRASDEDVPLDLQAVVNLAYERGAYGDLDYSQPLTPPLSPDDEARLRDQLA